MQIMSDLFDSLKSNKAKSTGKKRNSRELSPVKFPFSDDEDSDEIVLKKIPEMKARGSGRKSMSAETQRLLAKMKKCVVRLPLDKDGRLLHRIHEEWKKSRKNKKSNKYPIVRINKKDFKNLPAKIKTPEPPKKSGPKVYVKFPLSSPNSSKKKKKFAKTPKKPLKPKPRGHDVAIKRLNATPALVREFGKRFFMSFVNIERCNFKKMLKNPTPSPPKKKKKHNSSVTFNETVEVFGSSSSDEELSDPMPVSLVTAINGSTPTNNKKRGKKTKSMAILTPAAKKNYRVSDEKKITANDIDEDEEEEYIIPESEISPPIIQLSPTQHSNSKTPSPEISVEKPSHDESVQDQENVQDTSTNEEATENTENAKVSTPEPLESVDNNKESTPEIVDSSENVKLSDAKTSTPEPSESFEEEEKDAELSENVKASTPEPSDSFEDPKDAEPSDNAKQSTPEPSDSFEKQSTPDPMVQGSNLDESIDDDEPQDTSINEPMDQDQEPEQDTEQEEQENSEEQRNNSHNDFDNDEDSQGQNIVQDFISRTVQDLSHDDSEDIQDDDELVDDKQKSPPHGDSNMDNNVSNSGEQPNIQSRFDSFCQAVKEKFMGTSENNDQESDNA